MSAPMLQAQSAGGEDSTRLQMVVIEGCAVCEAMREAVRHLESTAPMALRVTVRVLPEGVGRSLHDRFGEGRLPLWSLYRGGIKIRFWNGGFAGETKEARADHLARYLEESLGLFSANETAKRTEGAPGGFLGTAARVAASGFAAVSAARKRERLMLCARCEVYEAKSDTCRLCRCNMTLKASFAAASCPAGKWGGESGR